VHSPNNTWTYGTGTYACTTDAEDINEDNGEEGWSSSSLAAACAQPVTTRHVPSKSTLPRRTSTRSGVVRPCRGSRRVNRLLELSFEEPPHQRRIPRTIRGRTDARDCERIAPRWTSCRRLASAEVIEALPVSMTRNHHPARVLSPEILITAHPASKRHA